MVAKKIQVTIRWIKMIRANLGANISSLAFGNKTYYLRIF
jgi:hypothetical protein